MDKAKKKVVATKEESSTVDLSESETWSFHEEEAKGRPVAYTTVTGKPGASSKSENSEILKLKERNGHTIYTCLQPQCLTWKQYSRSSEKAIEREPADPMEDLEVNAAIWSMILNTTIQAAVPLGQDYKVNLRLVKNHLWNSVEQLFNEAGRLIRDQTEIIGVTTIHFKEVTWRSAYCAAELIRSRMPKPTSSPTRCFVL